LFSIFKSFSNEIKNQFGILIQTLRNDNAHESLSHSFNTSMKFENIIYQTSRAYTSHLNKMGWLSIRKDILLKLLAFFKFMVRYLNDFGVMLFLMHFIQLIVWSSLVLQNKIFHSIYFLMNLSIPYSLKFLGLHDLFTIFVLVMINYLFGHTNVSLRVY